MIGKRILIFYFHDFPVKIIIFIKIITKMKYTVTSDQILAKLYVAQILHIKDPVHKVKLVLEMIVETFAVHIAFCSDI